MGNGGDKATANNGGVRWGGLGNELVENKSTCVKTLILQNAPNKEDLT